MTRNALQISTGEAGPALTPQQKRFNTLIRQIEQARETLAKWHDNVATYRQVHAQEVLPLEAELMAARRRWVFALDGLLGRHGWTNTERDTLGELVCDAAGELLNARDEDDELKALFAKHAEVDFDTERQQMVRAMKNMAEAVTGLDLGDDKGIDTDADLLARVQQGMRERAAAGDAERSAKAAGRHKSAAQQRREAEAQEATQSVREIFRKLASALHPDRETDERQREVKTALMQKVNQAYASNDLLTMLQLQLQIEQIDAAHIASASVQRLKQYNKVLSKQLEELRVEVASVEMKFRIDFGSPHRGAANPSKLDQLIKQNVRHLRAELTQQQHDMRMLTDTAATKRWLKQQRQMLREAEFGFELF